MTMRLGTHSWTQRGPESTCPTNKLRWETAERRKGRRPGGMRSPANGQGQKMVQPKEASSGKGQSQKSHLAWWGSSLAPEGWKFYLHPLPTHHLFKATVGRTLWLWKVKYDKEAPQNHRYLHIPHCLIFDHPDSEIFHHHIANSRSTSNPEDSWAFHREEIEAGTSEGNSKRYCGESEHGKILCMFPARF